MTVEKSALIQWLLEGEDPSLHLRVYKHLLGYDDNTPEVVQARADISGSPSVRSLLNAMHPDGYWLQKNPRTNVFAGEDVLYGSFATTHFCLAYLAELGLDWTHPEVEKAADRYLALQKPDGDWLGHYSCLYAYNIRTYILLGYRLDGNVQRAIELMLRTERPDGGYLCDIHEGKGRRKFVKSCIRGSVKCLMAFAELPEYWQHPRCIQLVDYFLQRGGIYKAQHPGILVNKDMDRLSFPVVWRANSWEVLYALSKMGYGADERLGAAWKALDDRADPLGRFVLDWTPTECTWKVGARGALNRWITYYVLLARQYRAVFHNWQYAINS